MSPRTTFQDYRKAEGENWSKLKALDDSALAYKYAAEHDRADTPTLATGRAVHALVFEPETFGDNYVVWNGGDRKGNAWKDFKAEHVGQTIFKPDELEEAQAMALAVRTHPNVLPYLEGGQFETPLFWTDPATGIKCKGLADFINRPLRALIELKTARSIDMRRFGNDVVRYGYIPQLAHYKEGVTHALGWTPNLVLIIAVEKVAPYDVGVFVVDSEAQEYGAAVVAGHLETLKACRESDKWPGRYPEQTALIVPSYVYGEGDPVFSYVEE